MNSGSLQDLPHIGFHIRFAQDACPDSLYPAIWGDEYVVREAVDKVAVGNASVAIQEQCPAKAVGSGEIAHDVRAFLYVNADHLPVASAILLINPLNDRHLIFAALAPRRPEV